MSPVDFKICPCRMSLYFLASCRVDKSYLGPCVVTKPQKRSCRRVFSGPDRPMAPVGGSNLRNGRVTLSILVHPHSCAIMQILVICQEFSNYDNFIHFCILTV